MGRFDGLLTAEVLSRRDIAPGLMIIKVKPELKIDFKPGQYVTLHLDGISRPYSVVSAPGEDHLEFFIELVNGGELTLKLWSLKQGDKLNVFPNAKGKFVFEEDLRIRNHFFVATVTGIASFVSMVRHAAANDCWRDRNIFVFYGASYQDELAYAEELAGAKVCQYFPTISRPLELQNAGWKRYTGRANNVFLAFLKSKAGSFRTDDTLIYACGHPGMIEDIKFKAGAMGFNIREEKYYI